jgi:hypothetical protein
MTLTELAAEVERQAAAKMDFIASTDNLEMRVDPVHVPDEEAKVQSHIRLAVRGEDIALSGSAYDINRNAHQQIGDRVGIPKKYYDRMVQEAPHLLAENVNHWLHEQPQRRMVRTLDSKARAFLSDQYQRRDNFDLMRFLLPVLTKTDETGIVPWRFESQALTEDHLHLKLVHTHAATITTIRGVDDIVHAGIAIRNSEVGKSSLAVEPMLWWKWCLNGCITRRYSQRKVHFGARQGGDDPVAIMLSDETKKLEDEAFFSKAKDVIAYFANPATFEKIVAEIGETTDREFTGKIEKGVEILGDQLNLQSNEVEGVLRNLIDNADRYGLTQYGLLNAVTATSQKVDDYERATYLEAAADKIIDLNPSQWREISEAA